MESLLETTYPYPLGEHTATAAEEVCGSGPRVDPRTAHVQRLESIGLLASGVAHELGSPIGVVMSLAHLIMDDEDATERAQGFASIIRAEADRMASIVRTLLSYSREDVETAHPTDLKEVIEEVLMLMRSSLRKDRIEVVERIAPALPRVHCRSRQIQQVLMNLLSNARDASNARYPGAAPDKVIRVVAKPFERSGDLWVRITIEDNGTGIHPDVCHRLFDPFFTTKPEGQGTGLGLSISHGIVTEHRGQLRFESRPDIGTRFHVDLKAITEPCDD